MISMYAQYTSSKIRTFIPHHEQEFRWCRGRREAYEIGINTSLSRHPESEGWINHSVSVCNIRQEILEIAKEFTIKWLEETR